MEEPKKKREPEDYTNLTKEEKLIIRQHRRARKRNPKSWRYGIEMPEFSGKSYKQLQDVGPINMRTSSEAYYILCSFLPAWEKLKFFTAELLGLSVKKADLRFHDIGMLAWCSRCEEFAEGLMADSTMVQWGLMAEKKSKVFFIRKSILTRHGLIENIPNGPEHGLPTFYAYRLTQRGRIVLRKFVDLVEESHSVLRRLEKADVAVLDKWMLKMTNR